MRRALNDAKPSSCWGMGAHDPCTQSRSKADCSCTTPLGRQVSDDLNTPGQVRTRLTSLRMPLVGLFGQDLPPTVPLSRTAAQEPNKPLLLHSKLTQLPITT